MPRLVDGSGRREDFAALSYCWGCESELILTAESEEHLRAGIPLQAFPANLRDAIIITQRLGIRYIWIDALCILQDSPEDWATEAAKMGQVYKGAVVTIAAASANKASAGMFRERRSSFGPYRVPWKNGKVSCEHVYLRRALELGDTRVPSQPINKRAWTLQESLLAPRTLWLCDEQHMFECGEGQMDEAGRSLPATEIYRSKDFIQQISTHRRHMRVSRLLRALSIPPVVNLPYMSSMPASKIHSRQLYTQGGLVSTIDRKKLTFYDHW